MQEEAVKESEKETTTASEAQAETENVVNVQADKHEKNNKLVGKKGSCIT